MRAKTARITSWTATITTLMAAGLASGPAAQAATPEVVPVACSAAALAAALSSAGEGATLTLAARCTYLLTAGLPAISDDLSIVGHGATLQRSTAPGTPKFAIIEVNDGGLTVSDLNFRNGVPAIDFAGSDELTVNGGLFSGNKGAGAITDTGPSGPQVNGATFTWNTTAGSGGAIYDDSDVGGAIVTNSTFYGNTAAGYGGAIAEWAQENGVFSRDVIYDNRAGGPGGGIADSNSSLIENSKIFGNRASAGGGLWMSGQVAAMLTGTSVWGNSAENGGGIYDHGENEFSLQVTDDKITGNYASADGGGIYNLANASPMGLLNLAHTRISYNDAGSLGGGIYNAGAAAAADTTISRNTARGGGGIYQATDGDGYGVSLTNSAVLHNIPDNCEPPGTITGCSD